MGKKKREKQKKKDQANAQANRKRTAIGLGGLAIVAAAAGQQRNGGEGEKKKGAKNGKHALRKKSDVKKSNAKYLSESSGEEYDGQPTIPAIAEKRRAASRNR